jgi:signal peptidase
MPKRIFNLCFTAFSVLLLAFSLVTLVITLTSRFSGKTPTMFGFSMHIVVTKSMEPEIMTDDLVIARKTEIADINARFEAGETIDLLYQQGDRIIVHRILSIFPDGRYQTYGINNTGPDSWQVKPEDVVGIRVATSTGWGKFFSFFTKQSWLLFAMILIVLGVIIVTEVINIIRQKQKIEAEKAEKALDEKRGSILDQAKADALAEIKRQTQAPDTGGTADKNGE